MNKLFFFFLFTGIVCSAQVQKIQFQYDAAGNQIIRKLCLPCLAKNTDNTKEISNLKDSDFKKFFPEDVISYYPNPVKELLYLKWENVQNNSVSSIQLFSLTGQLLKSYNNLENINSFTIPFSDLPQNVYTINLVYTYGEHKPIKIVKE
jgi:Secretion system C-terminal sorting domain